MDNARLKDNYEVDVASDENDVSDGEDYHDPSSDGKCKGFKSSCLISVNLQSKTFFSLV